MNDEKIRRTPFVNQLLLIVMGAMLVYLVVSFARQVTISHQESAELSRVNDEIHQVVVAKAQLEEYAEYIRSSEGLERWARQQGWTRPNEVKVVAVGGRTEEPPRKQEIVENGKKADSPQGAWWDLFFSTQ